MQELLGQWSRGQAETGRDRALARRLSAQRTDGDPASTVGTGAVDAAAGAESDPVEDDRAVVALPGVIDLLEHRERKAALEVVDDLDVFAQ